MLSQYTSNIFIISYINGTTFPVLRRVCNNFILGHCIMIMILSDKVIRKKVLGRKFLSHLTNLYKCRCVCQICASSPLSIPFHSSTGLILTTQRRLYSTNTDYVRQFRTVQEMNQSLLEKFKSFLYFIVRTRRDLQVQPVH